MYTPSAFDEVSKILNRYTINEIKELRYAVARTAIHSKIGRDKVLDICKELVKISYNSLVQEGLDEEKFLEPLAAMLNSGKCPCEI